jgi:hypothetical protein
MSQRRAQEGFLKRYLDPMIRLGEILFALIMVLTSALIAGLSANSRTRVCAKSCTPRSGVVAFVGIIDAVR